MDMTSRGERICTLLFGISTAVGDSVRPIVNAILARLLHRG